jgi:hypothetical protein
MKLSQLSSSEFKTAFQTLMKSQLPIKTTFALKKLTIKLESELKLFEETRESIVKEFGEKDEQGNLKQNENGMVNLDLSKASEWQPKIQELMALETEVQSFELSDLGDKLELSTAELFALGDLIKVD